MSEKYIRCYGRRLILAAAVLPQLIAGAVRGEESEPGKCQDAAYKFYNECLMGADSFWQKYLCDVAFNIDLLVCNQQSR